MNDGPLPHQYPNTPDAPDDYIAWRCQACGQWCNDYGNDGDCSVDWRNQR